MLFIWYISEWYRWTYIYLQHLPCPNLLYRCKSSQAFLYTDQVQLSCFQSLSDKSGLPGGSWRTDIVLFLNNPPHNPKYWIYHTKLSSFSQVCVHTVALSSHVEGQQNSFWWAKVQSRSLNWGTDCRKEDTLFHDLTQRMLNISLKVHQTIVYRLNIKLSAYLYSMSGVYRHSK